MRRLRHIVHSTLNWGIAHLPLRVAERIETAARLRLGKGWGTATVNAEATTCLDLLAPADRTHPVVLDVGANVGAWTAALLQLAPAASVIAFEPSASAFATVAERFASDPRVTLVNAAVGREAGRRQLWSDQPGSGMASLSQRQLDHLGIEFVHTEDVDVVTIDEWCAAHRVQPQIVKLDIEGHELEALEGARQTLLGVQVVQFEFGGCNIDTRTYFRDFYVLFEHAGFDLFRLSPRGLMSLPHYSEQDEAFQTTNFYAVRRKPAPASNSSKD